MLMVTHQEGSVSISVNCTGSSFTHCSVVAWQPVRPCLSVTLPSQPACHIPKAHSVSCAPGSLLATTGFIPRHSSLSQTLLSVCHNWLCFRSFSSSRLLFLFQPSLPQQFRYRAKPIFILSSLCPNTHCHPWRLIRSSSCILRRSFRTAVPDKIKSDQKMDCLETSSPPQSLGQPSSPRLSPFCTFSSHYAISPFYLTIIFSYPS